MLCQYQITKESRNGLHENNVLQFSTNFDTPLSIIRCHELLQTHQKTSLKKIKNNKDGTLGAYTKHEWEVQYYNIAAFLANKLIHK